MSLTLEYGYSKGLPPHATTAWGARLIFPDDLVHDRQVASGPRKQELLDYLNENVAGRDRRQAKMIASEGRMRPYDDAEFLLFHDERVRVVGNPMRSYGYLYVVAYFIDEDTPE